MTDDAIRAAAFARLVMLTRIHGRVLPWSQISTPIPVDGERVHIANKARGIFRPRQMRRGVLSIKTTIPRTGRVARYEDLADSSMGGWFSYRFQGDDPYNHDNTCLREAWEDQVPLVYFFGLSEGRYEPLWPAYVTEWDPVGRVVRVQVAAADERMTQPSLSLAAPSTPSAEAPSWVAREPIARAYATYEAKARLHQDAFREQVLDAYASRCAICRFPRSELLDAAHIIEDREVLGVPEVPNGICLCRLHHAAYDRHMMGIRPDGVVVLGRRIKETRDGPTLEHGFLRFEAAKIELPTRAEDQPLPEYLQARFERFLAVG